MKRYAPLLLTFLFLPLLFSCFDLEEDLYDQLEKEDYYTDYESLMASVLRPYEHAKWAETNFSFWLQELSADQLVITQKREHWEDGGVWRMIHQHTWDTYEKNSEQMWNACYGGIGYCNNTLADIQELSYDNFGLCESDKRQHIAELTALRAYFQLLLLDAFRIPAISLTTEEEVSSATPQENFHFIEESLLNAIPDLPKAPSKNYEGRITLRIDLENNIKAQQSAGYARWAKLQNLKQAAKTINFLTEHGIEQYAELESKVAEISAANDEATAALKDVEHRLGNMAVLIKNLTTYKQLRPVVLEYRKAKDKAAFRREHESQLILYEAAAKAIKDAGITRLPDLAALKAEYRELDKQKARLYEQYGEVKRELKEYGIIKQNVDSILRVMPGKEQAQEL